MNIIDPNLYPNWNQVIGPTAGYPALYPPYLPPQLPSSTPTEKENPSRMANIKIEKIENGYLIIYSKQGVPEKRRFAADMRDVGDAVIAACTELELTGK